MKLVGLKRIKLIDSYKFKDSMKIWPNNNSKNILMPTTFSTVYWRKKYCKEV
jgi:hypothetical protein